MRHLDKHISALVDGEVGHEARDRALAHVTHCTACRDLLGAERAVKERLAAAGEPRPAARLVHDLLAVADPERAQSDTRTPPPDPVVPPLGPPSARRWGRGPRGRGDARHPAERRRPVARYTAAGVLSASALVVATAFVAGGDATSGHDPVVPPAAEFSVQHAVTSSTLPLRDAAFDAVTASFGGMQFAPAATTPAR